MQQPVRMIAALLTAIPLASGAAAAQDTRALFSVKGGATIEGSEDNLTGTAPAFGVAVAVPLWSRWRAEGEFWLPRYLEDARGEPKHRDVVFSLAAIRVVGGGRVRPFLLAGLSFTLTQDWFTFCTAERFVSAPGGRRPVMVACDEPDVIERRRERNDGRDGYALAGGGVEYLPSRRAGIVADIRVNLAPASVLLRPGVALFIRF